MYATWPIFKTLRDSAKWKQHTDRTCVFCKANWGTSICARGSIGVKKHYKVCWTMSLSVCCLNRKPRGRHGLPTITSSCYRIDWASPWGCENILAKRLPWGYSSCRFKFKLFIFPKNTNKATHFNNTLNTYKYQWEGKQKKQCLSRCLPREN